MAQIFISHASENNAQAAALGQWLTREGWTYFLAIDGNFVPGESWIRALLRESRRSGEVILLLSKAWQESPTCYAEGFIAKATEAHVIPVLMGPLDESKKTEFDDHLQRCDLTGQDDVEVFHVVHPRVVPAADVPFPRAGLAALAETLHSKFRRPRASRIDPDANPYPGLRAFEEKDEALFFGREEELTEVKNALLLDRTHPGARLFVINGASGVGKSSFLRAGLLPWLKWEDRDFIVLPLIRPASAAITGNSGLLTSLQFALKQRGFERTREDIEAEVSRAGLGAVLRNLQPAGSSIEKQKTIVVPIDQAEELVEDDAAQESRQLTRLIGGIQPDSAPVIFLLTMRLESMARIDLNKDLAELSSRKEHRLRPIEPWRLRDAIERPAQLHQEVAKRRIDINGNFVDALLKDVEGQPDALPLMALVLNRLFEQAGNSRAKEIGLQHYQEFGRIDGAINEVVKSALVEPGGHSMPATGQTPAEQLFEAIFPLLSIYDVQTKRWKRRRAPADAVAKLPPQARALIERLVDQRLLAITGKNEVEAAHEAVMRNWTAWSKWQERSVTNMTTIERVHRAALDWEHGDSRKTLLVHTGRERRAAAVLQRDETLKHRLEDVDLLYLRHCHRRDFRKQGLLLAAIAAAIPVVWSVWWTRGNDLPIDYAVLPFRWSAAKVLPLGNLHTPPTVELMPGTFVMGCLEGRDSVEGAECQQGDAVRVRMDMPCAMGAREVTFLEYDYYVWSSGPTDSPDRLVPSYPADSGFGRMDRPVIDVTWNNAQGYVRWLSNRTGQNWRLPTEKEWEYAARGGADGAFPWGKERVEDWANCTRCDDKFGGKKTAPVAHYKKPNGFGIYDTAGNVAEWVSDKASDDGTYRVLRGGSWMHDFKEVRTASRSEAKETHRDQIVGFRVCRDMPDIPERVQAGGSAKEAKP